MRAVRWRPGRAAHAGWLHWAVVQPTDADRKVPITPVCHRRVQGAKRGYLDRGAAACCCS